MLLVYLIMRVEVEFLYQFKLFQNRNLWSESKIIFLFHAHLLEMYFLKHVPGDYDVWYYILTNGQKIHPPYVHLYLNLLEVFAYFVIALNAN
jgi:hypothetical protein